MTSYSHRTKTSWLIFYAILREVRRLRRSFLVFTTSKMPPRRCVVQYCSRVSDKELGISMHTSPSSGNIRTKWKRFVSQHRKNFNPTATFGICSLHFETDCFTRAVHVKGTERRIKPGSVPTIWKVTSGSISERSRRRVSKAQFRRRASAVPNLIAIWFDRSTVGKQL